MKKVFIAEIRNEETDEIITKVSGYSEESLLEEMGKSKWSDYAKNELPEDNEDLGKEN